MDSLLLFPVAKGTILTDNILSSIVCLNQIVMVGVVIYYFGSITKGAARGIFYCTLFVVISYLLCALFILLMSLQSAVDKLGCTILNRGVIVSYYFAKYGIWVYSLVRIDLILSLTPGLSYSKQFMRNLHILIFLVALFCCSLGASLYDIKQIDIDSNYIYCTVEGPYWLPFIQGPPAECISLYCCWLFYSKMKILYNNLNDLEIQTNSEEYTDTDSQENKIEIAYIMRKYTVLSISSVISTYILLLALFTPIIWGLLAVDCSLNTLCLILFHKRFDNVYQCIFRCITNVQQFTALKSDEKNSSHTNLEHTSTVTSQINVKNP